MKIRNKLTYKFALIVASLLLVFSIAIYYFTSQYREEQFNKRLITKGLTTAKLFINIDEVDGKLLKIIDRNNLSALTKEQVTLYDKSSNVLYKSDDEKGVVLSDKLKEVIFRDERVFFNYGPHEAAGILYKDKDQKYIVIISAFDEFGWKKLKHLRNLLIAAYVSSIIIIVGAGWFFSGNSLSPISKIVNEVNSISASNLNTRLDEGNKQDEIALLAITFNKMLERLNYSFQTHKNFVSNASHELRTPLTSIKAQLQVALLNERKKVQYKNILESVLQDVDRLVDLSNDLLCLAQMGSSFSEFKLEKIRIDELLLSCIGMMNKKYPDQVIDFILESTPNDDNELIIVGNESLIKTALTNILDNACKYSKKLPVCIKVNLTGEKVIVNVKDTGVGIDEVDLPHIFDPFYRGSNIKHYAGNGIGLSLTKSIIHLHYGELTIYSQLDSGTTVTVSFSNVEKNLPDRK
jgi:signal transduction histidine kinase